VPDIFIKCIDGFLNDSQFVALMVWIIGVKIEMLVEGFVAVTFSSPTPFPFISANPQASPAGGPGDCKL
jgi:hypothetical protein